MSMQSNPEEFLKRARQEAVEDNLDMAEKELNEVWTLLAKEEAELRKAMDDLEKARKEYKSMEAEIGRNLVALGILEAMKASLRKYGEDVESLRRQTREMERIYLKALEARKNVTGVYRDSDQKLS